MHATSPLHLTILSTKYFVPLCPPPPPLLSLSLSELLIHRHGYVVLITLLEVDWFWAVIECWQQLPNSTHWWISCNCKGHVSYAPSNSIYLTNIANFLQISKALAGADRKDLMRKLPKFIYDEEKALEVSLFLFSLLCLMQILYLFV